MPAARPAEHSEHHEHDMADKKRNNCDGRTLGGNRTARRGILCPTRTPEEMPVSQQAPVYADRATGQTFADARAMVNAYLKQFAERAGLSGKALEELDAAGYTQVKKGSASIGINVLDDHGVLLFLAPVMAVPIIGREAFYRRLLELSFLATSDAAFAIDAEKDEVCVRALRRLSGLDYEEFEDLLDTVGKVADEWDDLLRAEFAEA